MSISSTGLYGSDTIVNSDLYNDVEALTEQVTTLSTSYLTTTQEHRDDTSQNRLDISSNLSKINDISDNKIPGLEYDISSNLSKIKDISYNMWHNKIRDLKDDITDISNNKDFIRHSQSVNSTLLYALPDPLPNPPIESGFNGVFCTDYGIDIVTQNFLFTNIGNFFSFTNTEY